MKISALGQRSDSAGTKVYEGLRDRILSGELEVGMWLVEVQIAEEFGVSRTPVREALRRLVDERLVAHDAYRGAVVRGISAQEASEIGEIHEVHDGLAARLAAQRVDQAGIDRLKALIGQMRERVTENDWDGAAHANEEFHGTIYDLAGNIRLSALARDLSVTMRRFSAGALADPQRAEQILVEHEELVKAMATRDPDQAEHAARTHGRACMSWTGSWLNSWHDLQPLRT
jgi:DNA-binding GntR family transcriptional regulator